MYSPGCLPRLVSYEDVKLKDSLRSSLQFLLIAELYELGLGCWNSLNKVMEFKGMVLLKILEFFKEYIELENERGTVCHKLSFTCRLPRRRSLGSSLVPPQRETWHEIRPKERQCGG